jgi:hypothetical protein
MRQMGGSTASLRARLGAGVLAAAVTITSGAMAATSAAALPDFGNPDGHFYVPPAGRSIRVIPST